MKASKAVPEAPTAPVYDVKRLRAIVYQLLGWSELQGAQREAFRRLVGSWALIAAGVDRQTAAEVWDCAPVAVDYRAERAAERLEHNRSFRQYAERIRDELRERLAPQERAAG
jgi:hypothetical protein